MGPQVPFPFGKYLNSPLQSLVKILINNILLKQSLTSSAIYDIIKHIKKEGEIFMFIYLKGTYYNTDHIVSADKTGKELEVEFVNGKIFKFSYENTELAMDEQKKIIREGSFIYLNGKYYNSKLILLADRTGKRITLELLSGKTVTIEYPGIIMSEIDFRNITGKEV